MKKVRLHDKVFGQAVSHAEIVRHIRELAKTLNKRWKESAQPPVFVSVLNGAFMFTAELMKHIDFTCELAFVKLSSYDKEKSAGKVSQIIGLDGHVIEGREVIVLEDIVETGNTVEALHELLSARNPETITYATLFFKPEAYMKPIKIDYYAMDLPNDFVIGFGLDYNQLGRNLKDAYTLLTE